MLLALIACLSGRAQTNGQFSGFVTDESGAAIPGATVTATSKRQGERRSTTTNGQGAYVLPQLLPDTYEVRVTTAGFQDNVQTIELGVGQSRTLDLVLSVSTQTTVVNVTETGGTAIDTSSARLGVNITSREVEDLPINGRTYSLLSLAAPGATNTTDGAFDKIRFNGKATEQNQYRYDGVDASAVFDAAPGWLTVSGSQFRLQNSVETIQEFRVDSGLYPAEYGTGTGGQINLVSKTGGNRFHGALFEYLRNDAFDARNFFDATDKSKLRMNQFGGNIGGPIVRDKLFFFGSFEALRQRAGLNVIETVPSAAARARAVPEIQPLLQAFPQGTQATSNPDIDLAQRSAVSVLNETNFSARVDYNMTATQRLYLRYLKDIGELDAPDNTVTPRRILAANKPDNAVVALSSTIGTRAVNEVKVGVNRAPTSLSVLPGVPGLEGIGINISGSIVQPGVNGGAPSGVASPGGVTRQSSAGNGRGSNYRGKTYSFIDNLSILLGAHQLKAGVEIRAIRVPLNQLGGLTYSYANLNNFLSNTGATAAYIGDLGVHVGEQEFYIGYIQDEWRIRPNLTINYGLRYEYYTPNREKNDRAQLFDAGSVRLLDPKTTDFYQADAKAFGPRFGLTWSPTALANRTVFRLGGGLYYGPGQYEDLIQPIESDVNRFTLGNQRYPVNLGALTSGPLPPQTPRAYDVFGYRVPERNIQFGGSVQQQLPYEIVAQVGYTGSLGRNLFQRSITNLITGVNPATGAVTRQNPAFGEIDYKTSGGRDSYNALQISVNRRFSQGLAIGTQYAWAHSLGTSQGSNEATTVQDPFCFECEKGDGPADIRHYLYLHGLYELPIGRGRRWVNEGMAATVFGGWQVGGVLNIRSGLPINAFIVRPDVVNVDPSSGRVMSASGAPTGGAVAVINTPGGGSTRATRRPNLVAGVDPYIKDRNSLQWLNPAAFSIPAPGEYGNLARNALRGPNFNQLDLMMTKRFAFTEEQSLEFRADFFNILNLVNFSAPPATLPQALPAVQPNQPFSPATAPGFGVITSTVGRTLGLGTSRQIQLSLRYQF
jgi:hypothetical protein